MVGSSASCHAQRMPYNESQRVMSRILRSDPGFDDPLRRTLAVDRRRGAVSRSVARQSVLENPSGYSIQFGDQTRLSHGWGGDDGVVESAVAAAWARRLVPPDRRNRVADQRTRLISVVEQDANHGLNGDMIVVGMPTIIVRNHGDRRVAKLGFSGQFCFRHVRHADDAASPGPV